MKKLIISAFLLISTSLVAQDNYIGFTKAQIKKAEKKFETQKCGTVQQGQADGYDCVLYTWTKKNSYGNLIKVWYYFDKIKHQCFKIVELFPADRESSEFVFALVMQDCYKNGQRWYPRKENVNQKAKYYVILDVRENKYLCQTTYLDTGE